MLPWSQYAVLICVNVCSRFQVQVCKSVCEKRILRVFTLYHRVHILTNAVFTVGVVIAMDFYQTTRSNVPGDSAVQITAVRTSNRTLLLLNLHSQGWYRSWNYRPGIFHLYIYSFLWSDTVTFEICFGHKISIFRWLPNNEGRLRVRMRRRFINTPNVCL